jgi:hypothetical protein
MFKVTYSDIKDKPPSHFPLTWSTDFRSFERALKLAHKLHKQNRDVILVETSEDGIFTWEFTAGSIHIVFSD